ncbi:MAG: condensation domain protein [Schlesneria sp.]|nr:condensation domain protein [Schlesneria sp.]
MNGFADQLPQSAISSDATQGLFPLPLSPFEQYMVQDDTNSYPMSFVLILKLNGNLNREAFEQSVDFALKRHPLLMSHVAQVRGKGLCWIPVTSPTPQVAWEEHGEPRKLPEQEKIDLATEIGLRVWVDRRPTVAELVFQFHHACTDGLGGVQFIGDLLACYGLKTAPEGAELPEIEPVCFERLLARTNYSHVESEAPPKTVSCPMMLSKRLMKLLRRQPAPLAATRKNSIGTPLEFPAIISRMIDRHTLQQLKVVAARKSVELNDLYLLEMFQTIRTWNLQNGKNRDNQWLRIGMPTSLRTPLHDQMPAANIVSYMFLTRRSSDCNQPDDLLADIHRQTSAIVNQQQGRFVAIGLKYMLKIPGLLWCLLRMNRCFTSVILTNVGDIRRQFTARFPLKQGRCVAGNVTLDVLTGAVPVRPNTRLSTSVGTYAGNLYVNMHCDPLSFTKEQAEQLADIFVTKLKQLIPADIAEERRAA